MARKPTVQNSNRVIWQTVSWLCMNL